MFTPGVMVKIATEGPLGLVHSPGDYKFIEDQWANEGDLCETVEYDGPLPAGWMMVLHLDTNTFCPVHSCMVEMV